MIARRLNFVSPDVAFAAFADQPYVAFLDSAASQDPRAKVSYLGLAPCATLTLASEADPYARLRHWLTGFETPARPAAWPFAFAGGAIGWIGYDLARAHAGIESRHQPVSDLPAGWFGLYTCLLGFDLVGRELFYLGPEASLAEIETRLASVSSSPPVLQPLPTLHWQAELDRNAYARLHEALRAYIAAGDVYQANLTLRFTALRPASLSVAALHQHLRHLSPAPFAAYLDTGTCGLACASPERFLRVYPNGEIETRPIKGTAPRQATAALDAQAAQALRANPKERAENLMITDLLRNDLGKLCAIGSVRVPELWSVESYAQAHHLVSAVTGRLRPGMDMFELLAATLPGGSITGAPKYRAMQIIDELEVAPRGAYCGMLAWMGFDGAMDSAIIIRTVTATQDRLYAQAGGGITWDSVWEAEYEEALVKLSPLLALGQ